MFTINIGLATNDGGTISPCHAIRTLEALGLIVAAHRVAVSNTEETLIARVVPELHSTPARGVALHHYERQIVFARLYDAALRLRQDCIAVQYPGDRVLQGHLIGPESAKWGQFNPALFITFNQERP